MGKRLILESESYRKIASKLLAKSGILNQLKGYGVVEITGSYSYNLMLSPDVDIIVISKKSSKKKAVQLLNELINKSWWNLFTFADWHQEKFRLKKWGWLPKGYYIRVKADYEGYRWNIDIWLISSSEHKKRKEFSVGMDKITNQQRGAILSLKNACNKRKIDATSVAIYDAVLKHNVKTLSDLRRWISKKNLSSRPRR